MAERVTLVMAAKVQGGYRQVRHRVAYQKMTPHASTTSASRIADSEIDSAAHTEDPIDRWVRHVDALQTVVLVALLTCLIGLLLYIPGFR